jgi:hypothetical protein
MAKLKRVYQIRYRVTQVLLTSCIFVFGALDAKGTECGIRSNTNDALVVGVYVDLPGATDVQARSSTDIILDHFQNHVTAGKPFNAIEFCSLTSTIFPALGTTNLFNLVAIRKMLSDSTKLATNESMKEKLNTFAINYLAFVKVDIGASADRLLFVRLDPSDASSKESASTDATMLNSKSITDFLDVSAAKISAFLRPPPLPKFAVLITCLDDQTQGRVRPDWLPDSVTKRIPIGLRDWLAEKKPYTKDMFPVNFEGTTCPFQMDPKKIDMKFSAEYGEQHWIVWTGQAYMSGETLNVDMRFVHFVNDQEVSGTASVGSSYDIEAKIFHTKIADPMARKWEEYLLGPFKSYRPDVLLPSYLETAPSPRPRR